MFLYFIFMQVVLLNDSSFLLIASLISPMTHGLLFGYNLISLKVNIRTDCLSKFVSVFSCVDKYGPVCDFKKGSYGCPNPNYFLHGTLSLKEGMIAWLDTHQVVVGSPQREHRLDFIII